MSDSFDRIRGGLETRDESAAEAVFAHFTGRLVALARSRLNPELKPKIDPEDVLQSVYRSFFARCATGEFAFESWDALWALLTVLTLRKCGHQVEYFHAARRNVGREQRPADWDPDASHSSFAAIDREPQPEEAAILTETLESLMRGMNEQERHILMLKLQGCTITEIADQVQRTRRTVQLLLERIRRDVQKLCEE